MRVQKRPKTLAEIDKIEICCSDCGRTKRWSREHIQSRGLPDTATLDDLGNHLVCSSCKSQGGNGFNVEIRDLRWAS